MIRSSTNRIAPHSRTSRRLAATMFGIVAPIFLLACPKEEEPQVPVQQQPMQPQPMQPMQTGLSPELQDKVSRACQRLNQCQAQGQVGAEYNSCMRDSGRPESYQGACGGQQTALIDCINNLQSCDQSMCATQSAAVTACGALPPGLLNGLFGR